MICRGGDLNLPTEFFGGSLHLTLLRNGRKTVAMDTDRYPTGSRVDVWWPGDEEWYTATVLKTRTEPHTIDGTKARCGDLLTMIPPPACNFLESKRRNGVNEMA